ncbi:MAG: hypothetical protein D6732_00760 [Methanobacteriota archaeon]|nr:MAG: hypothetical protein D6732_00760 [Euryarchaeota archaeon]
MATFYVKVSYSSGQPVKGSRVVLAFYGLSRANTSTEYTNSEGYAIFSGYDPGRADIIVDGSTRTTRYLNDGDTVSITI